MSESTCKAQGHQALIVEGSVPDMPNTRYHDPAFKSGVKIDLWRQKKKDV